MMLPIGIKDPRFGKWLSNWEGSFIVHKVLSKVANNWEVLKKVLSSYLGDARIRKYFIKKIHMYTYKESTSPQVGTIFDLGSRGEKSFKCSLQL